MKKLITEIGQTSKGQAVIVLQSDEGPYPMQLNGENFDPDAVADELGNNDMRNWSDADLQMKYGILAAYYVPGASASELASAADPVNIFRLILNKYFGYSLPYLPRCYYAFTAGRDDAFNYADITGRLTGKPDSACPADDVFK